MTTFQDIFKSDFLEKVSSFSALDMVIALLAALAIGLFIFFVYQKTFKGVMYSYSFGVSLIAMTLITTVLIMAVTSNVVLSLGMVGALSIVRFRTAIKEPMDIAYLFWAIAVGIMIGAGLLPLAVFSSIVIGILLVLFINHKTSDTPYILVLHCENEDGENTALQTIAASTKRYLIKSKTISKSGIEVTVEIRLKDGTTDFINNISGMNGISDVVLVSYNGEYMS